MNSRPHRGINPPPVTRYPPQRLRHNPPARVPLILLILYFCQKMLSESKKFLFPKGDPLLSDLLKKLLPSIRSSLNINN